jgi:hypothetical protein
MPRLPPRKICSRCGFSKEESQGEGEWGSCSDVSGDGDCQTGLHDCDTSSSNMTNTAVCIVGYVDGWNHVCNQTLAKSWPNNEIICPTTFRRAAMNDTIAGSANATGDPHQIVMPNHYDARAVWQNTTNDGLSVVGTSGHTECYKQIGGGDTCTATIGTHS